jgi:AAA+ ATPase superfamily predicted ATPase
MGFVDREKELAFLEGKWEEKRAQLIILWGKRRVGKTELIKRFVRDKPHIYFLSESSHESEQLKRFSHVVGQFFKEPLLETRGFGGWEESFKYLKDKNQRFVLVIDEFPYLIQSNPAMPSLFQKAWDEYWSKSSIYLILLGSSIGMMETEVLGYRAPLYGRRTGQWRIDPMPFESAGEFRKGKSFEDKLLHFSMAGGIPAYWLQFSPEKDFKKNLRDHVLKKGQMLYEEVEFILREELREPRYYFSLLHAIAQGKHRLSEIVNATGIPQPIANKYLSVLSDLKIITREVPVTEERPLKSKKGLYRIVDEFFRFWFKFVFPNRGDLELGRMENVMHYIQKELPQYIASIYEKVAVETLWRFKDRLFPFTSVGRWWDKNEGIDIVAISKDTNEILFGEVKWSEKPVGTNILDELVLKSRRVEWGRKGRKEYFCLFSRSGFTLPLIKRAGIEGIFLFRENQLQEIDKAISQPF